MLYFEIVPNSRKVGKMGFLKSLPGQFFGHGMFVGEIRGPNLRLNNE